MTLRYSTFLAEENADEEKEEFEQKARKELEDLRQRVSKGELINFRDAIEHQEASSHWYRQTNRRVRF